MDTLRAGDIVRVRSADEILATLDADGRLEALPFMPEMFAFCGRRFRVASRADKTCDRIERTGLRRVTGSGAVHLEGVRCDGGFHDGCEALCLIFWKEAWLERLPATERGGTSDASPVSPEALPHASHVFAAARKGTAPGTAETIYACQATEAMQFTAAPGPADCGVWRDVRCGNVSWGRAARTYLVERFNAFQARRGGTQYPPLVGRLTKTPAETLGVQPGELVQIKTRDEIVATLDADGRNRGLSFDREMLKFCGRTATVLRRVTRIIDEPTGRMVRMKRDCIVLDGVTCESHYHGLCPRAIYPFWREIWLRRTPVPVPRRAAGEPSFASFVLGSALQMVWRRLFRRRSADSARPSEAA